MEPGIAPVVRRFGALLFRMDRKLVMVFEALRSKRHER
jgi:hypothetical protein